MWLKEVFKKSKLKKENSCLSKRDEIVFTYNYHYFSDNTAL